MISFVFVCFCFLYHQVWYNLWIWGVDRASQLASSAGESWFFDFYILWTSQGPLHDEPCTQNSLTPVQNITHQITNISLTPVQNITHQITNNSLTPVQNITHQITNKKLTRSLDTALWEEMQLQFCVLQTWQSFTVTGSLRQKLKGGISFKIIFFACV